MRGQVGPGAAVALGGRDDPGPVVATEQHGVAGPPVVRRPDQRRGTGRGVEHASQHHLVDVGQVDQRHQRGVVGTVLQGGEAGAQRGAHPLGPVVRDHHADGRVVAPAGFVEQGAGLVGAGAQHDRDGVAALEQQPDRAVEEGHAARVAQQRLGTAHPAALAGGEEQPGDGHASGAGSMSRSARSTLPDPSARRSSSDQPRPRSSSKSRG